VNVWVGPQAGYGYGGYGGPYAYGYYSSWGVYPWSPYSYGYAPMFGAPPPPESFASGPSNASLSLVGGVGLQGAGVSPFLAMTADIGEFGLNFTGAALPSAPISGQSFEYMPFFSSHLTWSALNEPSARVRFEGGVAGIQAPAVGYLGPDVGVSAQFALAGPLGLEGAVRWMPLPANILDAQANISLHFGGLALRGGFRMLRLDDTAVAGPGNGGVDTLIGPQFSAGVVF